MLPFISQFSSKPDALLLFCRKTAPHAHRGDNILNLNQSQPCLVIIVCLVIQYQLGPILVEQDHLLAQEDYPRDKSSYYIPILNHSW